VSSLTKRVGVVIYAKVKAIIGGDDWAKLIALRRLDFWS
jgi:hypothetical protein